MEAGDADGGREARVVCVSVARVSRRLFSPAMHVMNDVCHRLVTVTMVYESHSHRARAKEDKLVIELVQQLRLRLKCI